ncbi:hypothetical protein RB653_007343 [Dictyostelium firmibasis]|uniref:PSI domain-containing protein n=1 Tax=Dictyostelium firmibasis TaxID=79012 RepID=A0AAN7YUK1_9MYCE
MNKFLLCFFLALALFLTFVNSSENDHQYSLVSNSSSSLSSSSSSGSVNSSSSFSNSTGCGEYSTCDDCREDKGCVWCGSEGICTEGTFYGTKPLNVNGACKDFMWMQCKIQGRWAILIAAGGAFLIIVFFFICVCCCCCRRKKEKGYRNIQQDDETERLVSRTPITDKRRDEMRAKWGIGAKSNNNSQSDSWR